MRSPISSTTPTPNDPMAIHPEPTATTIITATITATITTGEPRHDIQHAGGRS